jgi:hypothetical protein
LKLLIVVLMYQVYQTANVWGAIQQGDDYRTPW